MAQSKFTERLRLPLVPALIASFLVGTVLWIMMQQALFHSIRFVIPPWPYILINYCLPLMFLRIFPIVTTSIKGDTLTVGFSLGRYYKENIPLTNSISCEQTGYRCSLVQLFLPTYSQGGGRRKISLPGYRGDALILAYTKERFFSGARETIEIVIPTMKAEQLLNLITSYLPTDSTLQKTAGLNSTEKMSVES